jgi:hypothetical protein
MRLLTMAGLPTREMVDASHCYSSANQNDNRNVADLFGILRRSLVNPESFFQTGNV